MATKKSTFTTHSSEESFNLGQKIGSLIADPLLLGLNGDFGSGKTVFVQGLALDIDIRHDETRKINVIAYGHAAAGLIKALGLMNS